MAEDAETLFARAEAAISKAKRLVEAYQEWQDRTCRIVHRRGLRAVFVPNGRRAVYPQDLPELSRSPFEPFPSEDDET